MRVLANSEIDRKEWCSLVQTSATGTWFQTPEAYDFFASQPELFNAFAYGLENEGKLRGVCVGYVTKEKNLLKQFFTRRAIIIGGPVFADNATEEEVQVLMSSVREQLSAQAIYIETRNFNDYSTWRGAFEKAGFTYKPHLNFHVDTTSTTILEANLGKNRKRDIRTTIREGVTVVKNITEQHIREYYTILEDLYKTRVKTPLFPLSFFLALYKQQSSRFFLIEYQGSIVGGTVCVQLENKCLYEWFVCGKDGAFPHVFPSSYATYEGLKYAAEHGLPRFDMMGAGEPDKPYGVREFKARFGGKEVEYGRYIFVAKPLLYWFGNVGVKVLKKL